MPIEGSVEICNKMDGFNRSHTLMCACVRAFIRYYKYIGGILYSLDEVVVVVGT